jgi:hypothetical protein
MRIQGFTWAAAVDERDIDALPKKIRTSLLATKSIIGDGGWGGRAGECRTPDSQF